MSDLVKQYMRSVADEFIDDEASPELESELRDGLWGAMTEAERDETNELVKDIFGKWYGIDG